MALVDHSLIEGCTLQRLSLKKVTRIQLIAGFKGTLQNVCRAQTLTAEGVIPPVNWHPCLSAQVSIALNSLAQCHCSATSATLIKHTVLKVKIGRHHCMTWLEDSWEKNDK